MKDRIRENVLKLIDTIRTSVFNNDNSDLINYLIAMGFTEEELIAEYDFKDYEINLAKNKFCNEDMYSVEIKESFSCNSIVIASSPADAANIALKAYENGEIVTSHENMLCTRAIVRDRDNNILYELDTDSVSEA